MSMESEAHTQTAELILPVRESPGCHFLVAHEDMGYRIHQGCGELSALCPSSCDNGIYSKFSRSYELSERINLLDKRSTVFIESQFQPAVANGAGRLSASRILDDLSAGFRIGFATI
jgi:hypothetical protein